ncbi:TPA: hypothetical protein DDW35_09745 [Candidatus Sumerlaeota bacterium]|nr:hypothetical protein [Candidatus Sumerlaeota bacterium]
MKTWTIGKRQVLGFATLMAVMLCLGRFTWFKMLRIQHELDVVTKPHMPALKLAQLHDTNSKGIGSGR